jgi:hypothetical protein
MRNAQIVKALNLQDIPSKRFIVSWPYNSAEKNVLYEYSISAYFYDASLHRIPQHTVNQYVYFIDTEHKAKNAHGRSYVVRKRGLRE